MKVKIRFLMMVVLALGILVAGTACSFATSSEQTTVDTTQNSEIFAEEKDDPLFEHEEKEDVATETVDANLSQLAQLIAALSETDEISGEELEKVIAELEEIESIIMSVEGMVELSLEQMIMGLAELDHVSAEKLDELIAELEEIEGIIAQANVMVAYSFGQTATEFTETYEVSSGDPDGPIADYWEIEDSQVMPLPEEVAKVEILGGIHGIWGFDDSDEPAGWLAGVYGVVIYEDGTEHGFLGGIAKEHDSELEYGYLKGQYQDGDFWGTYHEYTGEAAGEFAGTYDIANSDGDTMINSFSGIWESSESEDRGYLEGSWAQKIGIRGAGEFGGKWFNSDDSLDVSVERPETDGKFRGHYAAMKLADDTVIYLFRGGWHSHEGDRGKFAGMGIHSRFYGIWRGEDVGGYMSGEAEEHRLQGVWGVFGEEDRGELYGEYGPFTRCEPPKPDWEDHEHICAEKQEMLDMLLDRIEYLEDRVEQLERQLEELAVDENLMLIQ